jgi:hypothetical protein
METEVGIQLGVEPVAIGWHGPVQVVILGTWNGASVVFERRLPEHAGDPLEGSWGDLTRPANPVAEGYVAVRAQDVGMVPEFRGPFTRDETRLMHFVDGPVRARVIPGDGKTPSLTLALSEPEDLPAPVIPGQVEA